MILRVSEKHKDVIDYLWKSINELYALLIIDSHGTILEFKTRQDFSMKHNMLYIEHIATLVSVRFKLADINTLLGGLEMTFNVFKECTMIVKPYGPDDILIMLVKNDPRYSEHLQNVKTKFYSN